MRALAFLCAATACLAAPLTPLEMQQRMGLGINLGNRIDLYNTTAREVKESYIEAYRAQGFSNVRIPVCWDGHTNESFPYLIDPDFLDLVFTYVNWSVNLWSLSQMAQF